MCAESVRKEIKLMLNSCRNISWEESLTIRYRYERKRPFTTTNHRQPNETAGLLMFLLYQWDQNYPLLEHNSEQKTNLGNTNQLLEELVFHHDCQAQAGILPAGVRAEVALSALTIPNSIHWRHTNCDKQQWGLTLYQVPFLLEKQDKNKKKNV